jgi:hypothetical protein
LLVDPRLRIAQEFVAEAVKISELAPHFVSDPADIGDVTLNDAEITALNRRRSLVGECRNLLREKFQLHHHRLAPFVDWLSALETPGKNFTVSMPLALDSPISVFLAVLSDKRSPINVRTESPAAPMKIKPPSGRISAAKTARQRPDLDPHRRDLLHAVWRRPADAAEADGAVTDLQRP